MTKEINYAYWTNLFIVPNEACYEEVAGYKIHLIINYELKNGGTAPIGKATREHFSDMSAEMRSVVEVQEWLNSNLKNLTDSDKLELAGYEG
jgi:hypothetical protein